MENQNNAHVSIDLGTEQGKQIFLAIASVIGGSAIATTAKEAKAPAETKVVKMPAPAASVPAVPSAPAAVAPAPSLPPVPATPAVPALPNVPAAPTVAPSAPSIPAAPAAPSIPAAPKAPSAPAAPKAPAPAKEPKAPKVAAAPAVPFESLDEEGKREAIKKLTTKWSKKGKTTDVKALFAAYGATNVETVDASYLDHFNWAITTFDTNGQDMAAVLGTFGAQ